MLLKKILVPTDFSESSEHALAVAVSISKKTGWPVTLLNVMKSKDLLKSTIQTMEDDGGVNPLLADVKNRLEALCAKYADVQISTELALESDTSKLNETIAASGAHLIVMGTKAVERYEEEKLVGDNTRSLVKNASCPVLIVKKKMLNAEIKTVVFTTNLDKKHAVILNELAELFNLLGTKVYLLCVSTPDNFITTTKFNSRLEEFVSECAIKSLEACLYNDTSREEGILNFSKAKATDLLVMPTHGRTGLNRFFYGSISENTLDFYDGLSMSVFHEA